MGILNLTPDSFHDGGAWNDTERAVAQAERMLREGADILDLGAQSTRPGAEKIGAQEEWARLYPVLSAVKKAYPDALLSIDTFHASVARRALDAGADLINDVSGGDADPEMWKVVADARAPYVMMHMQGTPATMQANPTYTDVVSDVYQNLQTKLFRAYDAGVTDVIADVGFGFGKTVAHNYALLDALPAVTGVLLDATPAADVSAKKLRLHHRLLNGESGALAFEARVLCICMDLAARRSTDLPDDVIALAQPYLVAEAAA